MANELLIRPVFRYSAITSTATGKGFSLAIQGATTFGSIEVNLIRYYRDPANPNSPPVPQSMPYELGTITFHPNTPDMFLVHVRRNIIPNVPSGMLDLGVGTISVTLDGSTGTPKSGSLPIGFGEPSPNFINALPKEAAAGSKRTAAKSKRTGAARGNGSVKKTSKKASVAPGPT